ncbi:MAG: HNH endonuclease [Mesorhizobium sp.]|nr:MAG: HNH endonuclease [Mesorhizobium sp.]
MRRPFLQSRVWREHVRPWQLAREPLCEWCKALECVVIATDVDHIRRPNGDAMLERDANNLQSLCKAHHSVKTRWEDAGSKGTLIVGYDVGGWPISWSPETGLQ